MGQLRVLGRTRISRDTTESTSIERQQQAIQQWAEAHGHQIVGWANDLDVSGGTDPFHTPQLGDWLNNRPDEFDCVAAWKLDRISRSTIKLNTLISWMIDRNKTLVSCTEGIDISTPVGRLIANVIGFLAEGELDAIRQRTKASQEKLRQDGRLSGKVSYGYRKVRLPDGGYQIQPDPVTGPKLLQAIQDVIDGKSVESVSTELGLNPQTVWQILRSKTLLAHVTHNGETVRDSEGNPVLKGEPLLSFDRFQRLQAALDKRSFTKTRTSGVQLLTGLAVCADCGGKLHNRTQTLGSRKYRYLYCRNCKGKSVKAEHAEHQIQHFLRNILAGSELLERIDIPASSTAQELAEINDALSDLVSLLGEGIYKAGTPQRQALDTRITALAHRQQQLSAQPSTPARIEWASTGQPWEQYWDSLTVEEKNRWLTDMAVKITFRNAAISDVELGDISRMVQGVKPGETLSNIRQALDLISSQFRQDSSENVQPYRVGVNGSQNGR